LLAFRRTVPPARGRAVRRPQRQRTTDGETISPSTHGTWPGAALTLTEVAGSHGASVSRPPAAALLGGRRAQLVGAPPPERRPRRGRAQPVSPAPVAVAGGTYRRALPRPPARPRQHRLRRLLHLLERRRQELRAQPEADPLQLRLAHRAAVPGALGPGAVRDRGAPRPALAAVERAGAWPASHNSDVGRAAQDIFAAEVSSLPGGGGSDWKAIAALVAAALLALAGAWWLLSRRRRRPLEAQQR
jgi:hypothetical protein